MSYAAILLPRAVNKPFDYRIPAGMQLTEGNYVQVLVGKTIEWGVVWQLLDSSEVPPEKIKSIQKYSPLPPMPALTRQFIEWVANYTLSPIGNVLAMAIRVPTIFDKERIYAPKNLITQEIPVTLSEEQKQAAEILCTAVEAKKYAAFLLDG